MGSGKKALAGMKWSILVNFVNAITGFVATPFLIHYFGRSDYGLISLAGSINAYMALMDLGLSSTNVRFFSNWLAKGDTLKVKKLMQTCTSFYGWVGVLNALVLFIISIFSKDIFNVTDYQDHILKQMLWLLAGMAVINWYTSCYNQIISATENVAWVMKRSLLTKILVIGVIIATLLFKLSLIEYFIGSLLVTLIVLPVTIRKIKKETPFVSLIGKFDRNIFKEILPYSLSVFSFGIFQFSYNQLKVVIVGIQGTIGAVTDFGIMASIAGLVAMVSNVFIQSLLPSSSRIVANNDKEGFDRIAYQGTHIITLVLCFCAFGLMSVDRDLMIIYVGESYLRLIPWLNIWLLLTITGNVSCISSLILGGTNVKPLAYSSAFASISAIAVSWFLVPEFQAGGVVLGMIVYNAVQQLFYYTYYWRVILRIDTLKIFIKTDIPFIMLGSIIVLFLDNLPHFSNHWINVLVFGIAFSAIFLSISYILLGKQSRNYLFNLIKQKA